MTRVDFYILNDAEVSTRIDVICQLAEKACDRSNRVFVYSSDAQLLQTIDDRLWVFRPMSFVAHALLTASQPPSLSDDDPVILSTGEPGNDRSVLINLDTAVPHFFSRFERTLEIINKQPVVQTAGRERYLFYKQRGYPLQHHNL